MEQVQLRQRWGLRWLIAVVTGLAETARRGLRWKFRILAVGAAVRVSSKKGMLRKGQRENGIQRDQSISRISHVLSEHQLQLRTAQTYSTCTRQRRVHCPHNSEWISYCQTVR
jgi:hypothetical protein